MMAKVMRCRGARGCGCYTHALGYALLRTLNRYIVHISWYVICISCGRSDARFVVVRIVSGFLGM